MAARAAVSGTDQAILIGDKGMRKEEAAQAARKESIALLTLEVQQADVAYNAMITEQGARHTLRETQSASGAPRRSLA